MRSTLGLAFLVGFVLIALSQPLLAAPPEVAVTGCAQHVPRGTIGYLTGDLSCGAVPVGVYLGRGARLDLRGFTLSGGNVTVGCEPCARSSCLAKTGKCFVYGGTLTGAGHSAIQGGKRVSVHDVTIGDFNAYAVIAFSRIDLRNAVISNDHDSNGIQANDRIEIEASQLTRAPVQARTVRLLSTSITGGSHYGVYGRNVRLDPGSSVTGNGISPNCGVSTFCFDLIAKGKPRVDPTASCGTSSAPFFPDTPPIPWGVCASD